MCAGRLARLGGCHKLFGGGTEGALPPAQVALEFTQRSWQHDEGLPAGDRVHAILQTRDGPSMGRHPRAAWLGSTAAILLFLITSIRHNWRPMTAAPWPRISMESSGSERLRVLIRKSGQNFTSFTGTIERELDAFSPVVRKPWRRCVGGRQRIDSANPVGEVVEA